MTITVQQFHRFAPRADADLVAPALAAAATRFGITSDLHVAHWLGHMDVESAGFTRLDENLNYSADRLCAVWPRRFPNATAAHPYAHNPEGLANKAYGGRLGNGDEASGDGWRFRGSGYMQITGRDNFEKTGLLIGLDLVQHPELLRQPGPAAMASAAFWQEHNLGKLADQDDVQGETQVINGGTTGLGARIDSIKRARTIWTG